MTTHATELESITTDSPRPVRTTDDDTHLPRVRFMCSFGGKILPRPHDNQLRYVGGDTRIVAVHRHSATYSSLLHKLSKFTGTTNISIKYQLPNEDLDSLITVTSDEDIENMIDEYDRFALTNNAASTSARLRLFLFLNDPVSRASSISSLLDGSTKREHWFLDALNGQGGPGLERGRSEVSSIVSEVPDYLFGLDQPDEQSREPKWKSRLNLADNISNSDPGSPAPVVSSSSPFCSTSSLANPEFPPAKTKLDNPVRVFDQKEAPIEVESFATEKTVGLPTGYAGNPQWRYVSDPPYQSPLQHVPFYYAPNTIPTGNVPIHPVQIRTQFQAFPPPPGQIPVGYPQMLPGMSQVYGGGVRPAAAMDPYNSMNQPVYYAVRNAYPGMVVSGGEELAGSEAKLDRVNQS